MIASEYDETNIRKGIILGWMLGMVMMALIWAATSSYQDEQELKRLEQQAQEQFQGLSHEII